MVDGLGVSQAIVVNVIFCHQVESNWPLNEGYQLKAKFDDIFGATRYIKTMEYIKDLRKRQISEIQELKIHFKNRQEWKGEKREDIKTLKQKQADLAAAQRTVTECIFQLELKEKSLQEMRDKSFYSQKLKTEIGFLEIRKAEILSSYKKIRDECNGGDVKTLAYEIMEQKKIKATKVTEHNDMLNVLDNLKKDKKALDIEKGKLEQDRKQLEGFQKQKFLECVKTLKEIKPNYEIGTDLNLLVNNLKERKKQRELQLDKLSKEISKLSQNQKAKLEMWKEAITDLEVLTGNIRKSSDSEVRQLLTTFPSANVFSQLCTFYGDMKEKSENARKKLLENRLMQCREKCARQRIMKELEKKQEKLKKSEQLLRRDYNYQEVEEHFDQKSQHKMEHDIKRQRLCTEHGSTSQVVNVSTVSPRTDGKCPSCDRDFIGSEAEVQKLRNKITCLEIDLKCAENNLWSHKTAIQREEENVKKLQEEESLAVNLMPNICLLDYYLKVISKHKTKIVAVQESKSEHGENFLKGMVKQQEKLQKEISVVSDALQKVECCIADTKRFNSLSENIKTNTSKLQVVTDKISRQEKYARALHKEIERFTKDINRKVYQEQTLHDYNSQREKKSADLQAVKQELNTAMAEQCKTRDSLSTKMTKEELEMEISGLSMIKSAEDGKIGVLEEAVEKLKEKINKNVDENYRGCAVATTEIAHKEKYYNALDSAIFNFHKMKMEEINRIIYEYWKKIYKGNDIDFIQVRSEESSSSGTTARRSYNYRVVMVSNGVEMDVRGRCSAGQKVLASLIIRLALAETFCLSCGVLALDEPTANLDYENKQGLASALTEIIENKMMKHMESNFQFIIITHDEAFVEMLKGSGYADHFYRMTKDEKGNSIINRKNISELQS